MKKLGCKKGSQGHTASEERAVSGSSEHSFRYSTLLSGLRIQHLISHLMLTGSPWSWYYHVSLTQEETEAQRGLMTRPRSHRCVVSECGFEPGRSLSRVQVLLDSVTRQQCGDWHRDCVTWSGTGRAERIVRDCKTCPSLRWGQCCVFGPIAHDLKSDKSKTSSFPKMWSLWLARSHSSSQLSESHAPLDRHGYQGSVDSRISDFRHAWLLCAEGLVFDRC